MQIRLSIDRFEDDKKQIAVLLTEDGTAINFPKACCRRAQGRRSPHASDRAGHRVHAEAGGGYRKVQDQLKKTDPGGDLKL